MKLFYRSHDTDEVVRIADDPPADDGLTVVLDGEPDGAGSVATLERPPSAVEEAPAQPRARWSHRARLAFRRWRRTRPFWAGFWTVLAGFQIAYGPATAYKLLFVTNSVWIGVSVGVFVFAMGLFVWFTPRLHQLYGLIIVIASLVSLLTSDLGGFVVGMLLGMIGGSMAFAWTPVTAFPNKRRRHRRAHEEPAAPESVPV